LSQAIQSNQTLTSINLAKNNIGDEGVNSLSQVIRNNQTLTSINLSNNNIGDEGFRSLAVGCYLRTTQLPIRVFPEEKIENEIKRCRCIMSLMLSTICVGPQTNPFQRFLQNGLFDRHLLPLIFQYFSYEKPQPICTTTTSSTSTTSSTTPSCQSSPSTDGDRIFIIYSISAFERNELFPFRTTITL